MPMFHILVVDDDKNTRRLLKAVLEADGFSVVTACYDLPVLMVQARAEAPLRPRHRRQRTGGNRLYRSVAQGNRLSREKERT